MCYLPFEIPALFRLLVETGPEASNVIEFALRAYLWGLWIITEEQLSRVAILRQPNGGFEI